MLAAGERTPGPSDYRADSRPTLPGKPAYTIAGRQSHASSKHSTPGPGAYAVRGNSKTVGSHPNAPGYSMPASGRPTLQSHRLPGPGGKSHPSSSACTMQQRLTMLPANRATDVLHPVMATSFSIYNVGFSFAVDLSLPNLPLVNVCLKLHHADRVKSRPNHA